MVIYNKLFLLRAKLNRCIDAKNFLKSPRFSFLSPSFYFLFQSFSSLHFSFPLIHQESFLPPMTRYPLELLFKSRKQCSSLISIVFPPSVSFPSSSSIFSLSSPVVSRYPRSIRSLCREILFLTPPPSPPRPRAKAI